MPITLERFHDLLREHERALAQAHEVADTLILVSNEPPTTDTHYHMRVLALELRNKLPDFLARTERRYYDKHLKQNLRARQKMHDQRRANGVPERKGYSGLSPGDALVQLQVDGSYAPTGAAILRMETLRENLPAPDELSIPPLRQLSVQELDPHAPKPDAQTDSAAPAADENTERCYQFFLEKKSATAEQLIAFCIASGLDIDVDGTLDALVAAGKLERKGDHYTLGNGVPRAEETGA
jgi:hypothetical protein